MREVNGVIESNNGHTVFTDRGFSSASEAFAMPASNDMDVSNTTLVTTVFVVLMMTALLVMRNGHRSEDPAAEKNPRGGPDEKKDRDYLQ